MRAQTWRAPQRHVLTHDAPQTVLAAVRAVRAVRAAVAAAAAEQRADATASAAVLTHRLESLEKRLAQIPYAPFAAPGYPRGSGRVESATKPVVEARLKGAGLRWARAHAGPRQPAGGAAHRGLQ